MNNRLKKIFLLIIILIMNVLVLFLVNIQSKTDIKVSYNVVSSQASNYQLFYSFDENFGDYVLNKNYKNIGEKQKMTFSIPRESERLRIDVGDFPAEIQLDNFEITYFWKSIDISSSIDGDPGSMNDISSFNNINGEIIINSSGNDPFITMNLNGIQNEILKSVDKYINILAKILICFMLTVGTIIFYKSRTVIKEMFHDIWSSKGLILNLSRNDFKNRFSGSYLGITWAFVQPIVVVIIYWFVFEVGFKSAPMNDFPFLLWLIAGIVPWFFFNESLLNATNTFLEYSYLVKKVVFKISILPVVKIMSAFYVHLFFILFANIVYISYGYIPSVYMIQSFYYSLCTFVLALGISYITSSIVIFFKDLGQIVSILLQFGMWMTPIMYSEDMMPGSIRWILKINPMYYIVEGYRDTFIRHVWFFDRYNQTIYFWGITLFILIIGIVIFKKLKPHFSDVL
ncbi:MULTISPECIES: ABC transporter permease [Clostridium]|uniref:ABC transporter permease n=2 Tax=Clostridiaceae TaxID=31979 RepID=UPI000B161151|nr:MULTISPECIES: ABC transporter permease [Clostridium]MDU2679558.1 ABC transporter permease [Clostridium sp.]MDU4214113.1 ABC transporter permease [Clostridium sp.]MDU5175844.1 ABC transporter permease [Clostridium sp.]MDU7122554.1 ABC transporter permease [Clostridium sp.]MDU7261292.1 ABC transporter permease [Clostridium butyricum]